MEKIVYKSNLKIQAGENGQEITSYQVGDVGIKEISHNGLKKVIKSFNEEVEIKDLVVYQEERRSKVIHDTEFDDLKFFDHGIKKTSYNFGIQQTFDIDGSITLKALGKQDGFLGVPSVTKVLPDGKGGYDILVQLKTISTDETTLGKINEKTYLFNTEKNSRVVLSEKGNVQEALVEVGLVIGDEMVVLREEIKSNGHRVKKINGQPILVVKADENLFAYQKSTFQYDKKGQSIETREDLVGNVQIINQYPKENNHVVTQLSMDERRKEVLQRLEQGKKHLKQNKTLNGGLSFPN